MRPNGKIDSYVLYVGYTERKIIPNWAKEELMIFSFKDKELQAISISLQDMKVGRGDL